MWVVILHTFGVARVDPLHFVIYEEQQCRSEHPDCTSFLSCGEKVVYFQQDLRRITVVLSAQETGECVFMGTYGLAEIPVE